MLFVRIAPRSLLLGILFAGALGTVQAQLGAGQLDLKGRESRYDDATKEVVVTGDARLAYGDAVLTADEIRFNSGSQIATAKGNLVITAGARRLVADEGTYNPSTGIITARNLRVGQFPVYVTGETVEGTFDELVFTHATVFFREDARYTPSIHATKLTYAKGRIVRAEGLAVGLLGGHFLHFPKFEQTLDTDFVSYLSAHLGYRGRLGVFAELGLHIPVADGVKLGADVGLYSSRGVMVGPAGRYDRVRGDNSVMGFFRSGYISDSGDRRTDILGDPVPRDRSFITWEHRQRHGEHFTLDGEFNYWSDSEILRDFRHHDYDEVQQPDSFLEAAYLRDNYALSAFARFHPNRYHRVRERLPELRFDLMPSPLGPGVYQRFSASAAALESDAFGTDPRLRTERFDAYYGLEKPFAPTRWFTFTPVAGGRVTHYTDALGGKDNYTRSLGEFGFDARLLASGTFDYKNERWDIDGLRHLIEPRVSYRYAPKATRGRAYIPPIDARVFTTYLQPLSIADTRHIDDLTALNTMRFSLNNTLQTRDAHYGSRDLAALNFAADYNFDAPANRHSLSDIYTEFTLTPAPWLRWEVFHRFDPHQERQQEINTGLSIVDQEWWTVRLATHFLKSDYQEYLLEYRQRINEVYDVTGLWRYDARNDRFNEQSYGLWQRLGQTWAIKYEVSFFDGPRRESAFSLNVEVQLLKF